MLSNDEGHMYMYITHILLLLYRLFLFYHVYQFINSVEIFNLGSKLFIYIFFILSNVLFNRSYVCLFISLTMIMSSIYNIYHNYNSVCTSYHCCELGLYLLP